MKTGTFLLLSVLVGMTLPSAGRADGGYLGGGHATGTWAGLRPALTARGVDVGLVYTADLQRPSGGGGRYLALVDGWVELDTGKLGLWPGGLVFVGGQNAHGQAPGDGLVPFQTVSNNDTPAFTQLGECFYEQHLLGGGLWLRVGKQDTNRDFGSPRYPGNFINGAYGALPTVPMPSHPTPAFGLMTGARLGSYLRLRAGAFEGRPTYGGWGLAADVLDRRRGLFSVAALELVSAAEDGRPAGRHAIGVWHHSGEPSGQGSFVTLDQRLYRASGDDGGFHLFARGAVARAGLGQASAYAGGGLAYHGPIAERGDDTVGLGASTVWLEGRSGRRAESFVELFYKARFTRFFSLQPDLQLFRHPQGESEHGWAFTLRGRVKL